MTDFIQRPSRWPTKVRAALYLLTLAPLCAFTPLPTPFDDESPERARRSFLHSTYLGGEGDDVIRALTVDVDGSVLVAAWTGSSRYADDDPTGQPVPASPDVVISRLSRDLSQIQASLRISATGSEIPSSIGVAPDGRVVVLGITDSADFPFTKRNGIQRSEDDEDVFIAVCSQDLSRLEFAERLGGSEDEKPFAFQMASNGVLYVTGCTDSSDFPTTAGAQNRTYRGKGDSFVLAYDLMSQSLLWSTLLGGREQDDLWDLALTKDQRSVWVIGRSYSVDFPVTADSLDTTWNGSFDVVLAELDTSSSKIVQSTFFGGIRRDEGKAVTISDNGEVFITGVARSPDFPTTRDAFDRSLNGHYDVFVARFSPEGDLRSSTLVGGETTDQAQDIVVLPPKEVVLCGLTYSSLYPTTPGAFDETFNGVVDGFLTVLDLDLRNVLNSTFVGGPRDDVLYVLEYDPRAGFYAAGTSRGEFPATRGGADESHNGALDAVITRVPNLRSVSGR